MRSALRFIGSSHQNAQEFLRFYIQCLPEDVNRVIDKLESRVVVIDHKTSANIKASVLWSEYLQTKNSELVDHFVGYLKMMLRCTKCTYCAVPFNPFWDLSLYIPQLTGSLSLPVPR
ncbi:unnamed protein product [Phaedon cochleariae]|uniref:ubiquitinyl hydrolase 1 n=1 Tax=Phaedon cochleariae TaxID=80249 RepID=A0A9N9X0Q7_PHACE|nr:unnamed protein product [Phaedon cochleariae]